MRTFAPSAMSVPQKPLFRCDNQCSEKTLSYWQLASLVSNAGEESYTTNLCQKCFNYSLKAKGEKPLTNVQCRWVVEKKDVPWKNHMCGRCGNTFSKKEQSKLVSGAG